MTDAQTPQPAALTDPADPPDAGIPAALAGRMLVQVNHKRQGRFREPLDDRLSGLVLAGEGALAKAGALREAGFGGALLADEARYETAAASPQAPFPGLDDEASRLFGDPLEDLLVAQLAFADAALTPTGYLHAEAAGALKAAAARVRQLADPRVVFTAPIDAAWLRPEPLKQLIAVLSEVPGCKAVMLGGQMDPLASFPGAVAGLAQLLAQVSDVAVLRTDLAAFGTLARGAAFTAFGADSSMRHVVPPPQPAKTSGGPNSPHVLFPELMGFFLGYSLAKKLADHAPICDCMECQGQALDRFTGMSLQVPAAAHNASVLMQWLGEMDAVPAAERAGWWQLRCRYALDRYPVWNAQIDQPRGFVPPTQLTAWAKLPVPVADPTEPGTP